MKYYLTIIGIVLLPHVTLWSQDYSVNFQNGTVPLSSFSQSSAENGDILDACAFEGNSYLILQFERVPDSTLRTVLANRGITLLAYIPNYAYLSKVPIGADLDSLDIRALAPYSGSFKLPQELAAGDYPDYAYIDGLLRVLVRPWPSVETGILKTDLESQGYGVGEQIGSLLRLNIDPDSLLSLAQHPGIQYISLPEPPPTLEGWVGRSAQRLNLLSAAPGIGYDGQGVSILIGDDGSVNHADFKGRLLDFTTTNFGTHGDMTLGLAGAAGNINPLGRGSASGAELRLYGIAGYPHIGAAVNVANSQGFAITSTSYGEGCGGIYSFSARDIDQQVYTWPSLLHHFSAGNNASSSCSNVYGGLSLDNFRYGNITGGRKAGKNVLTIGNLYYNDNRVASSSRGPAADGRIKPDLCAHGQGDLSTRPGHTYGLSGGTSAAAPSVAGTSASLVQAYRAFNNQQSPSAALIKGLLLNTADDLGRRGPDYDFGWGRPNAARALETLQNQQYFTGSVLDKANRTHTIFVPSGLAELRVMLYWTDAEGSPVAAKALVNDLDLTLATPSGNIHRPWKLSTVAHIDSITKPAYRGIDRINNVEQVSIDAPAAGTYQVKVDGHLVPSGAQQYVLVYTFLRNEIKLTFPSQGETLLPGETVSVRWDAQGGTGNFALEYSSNGGNSWQLIANGIPSTQRHFDWNVPNIASGQVRLRIRRGNQAHSTEGQFVVIGQPEIEISTVPGNKVRISWPAIPGANTYRIYRLGAKYMEPIGSSATNSYEFQPPSGQSHWYAVAAGTSGTAYGRRSLAKVHTFSACQASVTLRLNFDVWPGQTSWEIVDSDGNALASGGPYNSQAPLSSVNVDICLPYGCFELRMLDAQGNGMCCGSSGNGNYRLFGSDGEVLASGGQFGSEDIAPFCLAGSSNQPLALQFTSLGHVSCHGGNNGHIAAAASGGNGNYTYQWSNGSSASTISGLSAGFYSLTVSDGSQQAVRTVNIVQPNPLSLQFISVTPTCSGAANGVLQVQVSEGLEMDYTYAWSNGASTPIITGLSAGLYSLTVTNIQGCSAQGSVNLTAPQPLSLTISSGLASCSGSASLTGSGSGGTPPYAYQWNNGGQSATINGLQAGLYSLTLSDANGCTATQQAAVQLSNSLEVSVSVTPSSCSGSGGSATAAGSGGTAPYSYIWSFGATTASVFGLQPGAYSVTVIDASGCSASATVAIPSGGQGMTLQAVTNMPSCSGSSDGSLSAWVSGGMPPYAYAWSNGGSTPILTGLAAGTYGLTVTDGNGCSSSGSFLLNAPAALNATVSTSPANNGNNGSATISPSGGTPLYSYAWSNGLTVAAAGNLAPGNYQVTVSDAQDCTVLIGFAINDEAPALCEAYGISTLYEWIASVGIGAYTNDSGNNGGYADFTAEPGIALQAGQSHALSLVPAHAGFAFNEYWRVWIDFDQDGSFGGPGEEVFAAGPQSTTVTGSFSLPADLAADSYTLRIAMKYGSPPSPCGGFPYGEVEDYTIAVSTPVSYCSSGSLSASTEWIGQVQLGSIDNSSGNNNGYEDYTALVHEAEAGAVVPFVLQAEFYGSAVPVSWRIFVDLNGDGLFDEASEAVYQASNTPFSQNGAFTLPVDAAIGLTRVRIVMNYGIPAPPCGSYTWGETEDYSLLISPVGSLGDDGPTALQSAGSLRPAPQSRALAVEQVWRVYPNPTQVEAFADLELERDADLALMLYSASGALVYRRSMPLSAGAHRLSIPTAGLPAGLYWAVAEAAGQYWRASLVVE